MMEKKVVPLELKKLDSREFDGYGSTFGNVDHGGDVVLPGAFRNTIAEHKKSGHLPAMAWMHDLSRIPGKWLDMSEDEAGLAVKGVLAETELGNEMHTLLKLAAVRGLSIGFVTKEQEYTEEGTRLIKEVELWEVSLVALPMNPKAQIAHVKSRLSALGEYVPTTAEMAALKRDLEQWFRSNGMSRSMAVKYASNVFKESGAMPEPSKEEAGAISESSLSESDLEKLSKAMRSFNEELEVSAAMRRISRPK